MTTFALIHGAWHGAWCWERLTPELEAGGHRVVAVDLPSDDPAASFEDCADVVVAALAGAQEVIAVGHSLGGYALPLLAQRRPVRQLVYLCALLPEPGRSFVDQDREHQILSPGYTAGLEKVGGATRWADTDLARTLFYTECDDAAVAAALPRLRAQAVPPLKAPWTGPAPDGSAATYIVCTGDRMVDPAWSRRVAAEQLGVTPVELPGDHSPFLSHPVELAGVLHRLA